MTKCFITSGAELIGSSIVDRLISQRDNRVVVYDNFLTGQSRYIEKAKDNSNSNCSFVFSD
jgi:nucleoside-diphosphate-sugar epimerase